MQKLLSLLKNKYFLSTTAFLVWMLFFDRNDLLSQYEYRSQLQKLEQEKQFYTQEIAKVQKDLDELTTNKDKLEKFAREHYLMKRDNEDVFVIIEEEKKEEQKSLF
ncbi:FtsB family cell division protein [Pedobacter puniceum]|jgi:cell division protein FtsB|uniref:Septum formation initiator family protein n=1 Tax=Pedobacter puniceum TaxID=2666136 RepID=A0A7K0FSJ9_9SPHI|nr:septum formation initiator family protein [Pedobacter puniceum]MRX48057.1 septum formation initiator family protein [Pedobacter puniceum]